MTVKEIMTSLEKMGTESTRKIYTKHGAVGEFFGVKVGDMKTIQKKVKKDYDLSKGLYETGNGDAMYLAGLIADETKMTKKDLETWAKQAQWSWNSEYTVPWVASETKHGEALADKWIKAKKDTISACGWSTWSCIVQMKPDEELDTKKIKGMIDHVVKNIDKAPNRTRYTMNGFIISVAGAVSDLTEYAQKAAEKIGKVEVFMGETACKVPFAPDYIQKMKDKNRIGKKKKTCRC